MSLRCTYFSSLFLPTIEMHDTSQSTVSVDCSQEVMKSFLEYIYEDTVNFTLLNFQLISDLLILANHYTITRLQQLCEVELSNRINASNVIDTLLFSEVNRILITCVFISIR